MVTCSRVTLSEIELGRMDAEYYRPDLIRLSKCISERENVSIRRAGAVIDGSAFYPSIVSEYNLNHEGLPFLRVNEIQNGLLSIDDKTVFLRKEVLDRNRSTIAQCDPGDLIIAKGGNSLGKVALLTNRYPKYSVCRDVLVVRTQGLSRINRFYLWMYLHSGPGQSLLIRTASQTGQPHLTYESIARLRIPLIPNAEQDKIEASYHAAEKAIDLSRSANKQAQWLIESELGIDKISFDRPVGYTASLANAITSGRIDGEYFQPQYGLLRQIIQSYKYGYDRILQVADALKPNVDPSQTPASNFNYVELSQINSALGMIEGHTESSGAGLPSRARRQVSVGDVIASAVVGSVDKAALISPAEDGYIASTGFFHFRPKTVSSEYLLMLVRSRCVSMQFQQQATGGILSAVPDGRLKYAIVPRFPQKLQDKVTDLVAQAHQAKRESDALLEQAKVRVEQLIEEAIEQ